LIASSSHQDGRRLVWDVRDPDRGVVVELRDEHYDALIVEVADPEAAVTLLTNAIHRA
jgi:hypothetical protein